MSEVWVVTEHYHYETGTVLKVFKNQQDAETFIKERAGKSYKRKVTGTIHIEYVGPSHSYEAELFEIEE